MQSSKNKGTPIKTFAQTWDELHSGDSTSGSNIIIENNKYGWSLLNFPEKNQVFGTISNTPPSMNPAGFPQRYTDADSIVVYDQKEEPVSHSTFSWSYIMESIAKGTNFLRRSMPQISVPDLFSIAKLEYMGFVLILFSVFYTVYVSYLMSTGFHITIYTSWSYILAIINVSFILLHAMCLFRVGDHVDISGYMRQFLFMMVLIFSPYFFSICITYLRQWVYGK